MSGTSIRRRARLVLAAAALSPALAVAAAAQSSQYTAPGSLGQVPQSSRERLEQSMAEASWKLGKAKLRPRFWIRDVRWVDNVFSAPQGEQKTSDLRGTVGVGLDAFLNFGPKVVLTAYALPEYNYWREQTQLSGVTGRYGAGLFGFFNRLTASADAGLLERQRLLSSEFEVPVRVEVERGKADLELDLGGPWRLFGSFLDSRTRHDDDDVALDVPELELAALDRDETVTSGGLLFQSTRGWSVGLGLERSDTDFPVDPDGRSNTATSPLLRFSQEGRVLEIGLQAILQQIEFDSQALGEIEELTGRTWVDWALGEKSSVVLFGGRQLVYSAQDTSNYFIETRFGVRALRDFGSRLDLELFAELGEDEFREVGAFGLLRVDEQEAFGARLVLTFARRGSLRIGLIESSYDSNLPQFDREVGVLEIGLSLSGDELPF